MRNILIILLMVFGSFNFNVEAATNATSSPNVGIGTVAPVTALQVVGTVNATAFVGDGSGLTGISGGSIGIGTANTITFWPTTTTIGSLPTATYPSLTELSYVKGATSSLQTQINGLSVGSGGWTDAGANVFTTATTDTVGIGTTGASGSLEIVKQGSTIPLMVSSVATSDGDYLIVTSSGNLGIGTALPVHIVSVRKGNSSLLGLINSAASGSGAGAGIQGISDDNAAVVLGDRLAFYTFGGSADTGDTIVNGGAITGYSDGTWSATSAPTEVRIEVAPSGSTTRAVALVADSTSNVGIGTTTPQQKLQVVGTVAATAFTGDGSALTGISAGGWTDGGTNVFTSATTDTVGLGTTGASGTLEIVKQSSVIPLMVSSVATGDGDYLIVQSNGNVGIGTLLPRGTLDLGPSGTLYTQNITGTSGGFQSFAGNVGIGTTATPTVLLHIGDTAGSPTSVGANDVYIQNDLEVDGTVYMASCSGAGCSGASGFTDGGTNVYLTTANDNVAIGTTIPSYKLHIVAGSTDPFLLTGDSSGGTELRFKNTQAGAGDWAFGTGYSGAGGVGNYYIYENAPSSGTRVVVASGGNVGIGTTVPVQKLQVGGNASKIRMFDANGVGWNCGPAITTGAFTCS